MSETHSINQLEEYFKSYLPLDEIEKAELIARIKERRIKRKQFILTEGETCRNYTFVVEGCFKMYKVDEAGKEHNLFFASENDWIADIGSFHSEQPSELYIEAIELSKIIQIEREDLLYFYVNHPKFDRNFRVIIENQFVELQQRLLLTISSTAEERYKAFIKQYPDLLNRLSGTQIASYIGITPEFLSRIRSEMAQH